MVTCFIWHEFLDNAVLQGDAAAVYLGFSCQCLCCSSGGPSVTSVLTQPLPVHPASSTRTNVDTSREKSRLG